MTGGLPSATAQVGMLCGTFAAVLMLFSHTACAQDEGARAYELAPARSQALNLYGLFGRGNAIFNPGAAVAGGAALSVDGGILEYAHGVVVAGNAATLLASLPFGKASGSVSSDTDTAPRSGSRSGIGDLQLTAAFGLVGSPALDEKDYDSYRPRAALTLLARLYVPTGAYERNSAFNLGQNRWAAQLGLPLSLYVGESFLDPALASFELIPSVIVYGDNHEPPSGNIMRQAPLLQVESHLTRNLNSSVWVALDALFIDGGETTTDGVSDHNRQRSFAMGASGSVAVSDAVFVGLSYLQEVSRNSDGVSGHVIRVVVTFPL